MITGIGFFEIVLILVLVLMFFGSKEMPKFIRETARLISKLRLYSEKVRRELNEVTNIADDVLKPETPYNNEINDNKKKLRATGMNNRKALTREQRKEKSAQIAEHFFSTEEFKKAKAVMIYAATETEVQTEESIRTVLSQGKRVILPYCYQNSAELGIAEIKEFPADVSPGEYKILEPRADIRNNFLKSDIQLVVCPGVAFDKKGARLGRGKGCYDYFLKELKERITIVGFAFQCQILDEEIPFDYHDITMDILITEEGIKRFKENTSTG